LRYLFDEGGVHSALSHDVIEAGASERALVDKEASEIASRAVEQLRMSRAQVAASPITRPTWTGRAGSAGAPRPRFGSVSRSSSALAGAPSSSALLGRLKSLAPGSEAPVAPLQHVAVAAAHRRCRRAPRRVGSRSWRLRARTRCRTHVTVSTVCSQGRHDVVDATALLSFLRSRPFHCATTQAIAAKFEESVTSEAAHAFRELLKKVAQFDKASKVWRLRAEFEDRDAE
jgi:DNA excision repair protein ERCC-6